MPLPLPDPQKLKRWSRDRDFLLRAVAGIMAISVVIGTLTWMAFPAGPPSERTPEYLMNQVRRAPVYWVAENVSPSPWPEESPVPRIPELPSGNFLLSWLIQEWEESRPHSDLLLVLSNYAQALYLKDEAATGNLREAAESGKPFAQEALGDLAFLDNRPEDAIHHWEAELDVRHSDYALTRLMEEALREDNHDRLRELARRPGYLTRASAGTLMEALVELRDYGGMLRVLIRMEYGANLLTPQSFLALFVALVWVVIVGEFAGFRRGQIGIYLLALLLGMFSATLTLYVLYIQHNILGTVKDSPELIDGIIHAVAGVGLREETLKLLCFIPLVLLLRRRRSDIEVLVVAGFVGLGFALNENLGYYGLGGEVAPSRFLTANFFHLAATGLIGYEFYRMTLAPGRNWERFLSTFLVVVLAHGFYDAVLMVPALMDLSLVTLIILALLTYRYLDLAQELRPTKRQHFSPLGIFVIGAALIVGASVNVMYFARPPWPDYVKFLLASASLLPVAFIFINRFRDA